MAASEEPCWFPFQSQLPTSPPTNCSHGRNVATMLLHRCLWLFRSVCARDHSKGWPEYLNGKHGTNIQIPPTLYIFSEEWYVGSELWPHTNPTERPVICQNLLYSYVGRNLENGLTSSPICIVVCGVVHLCRVVGVIRTDWFWIPLLFVSVVCMAMNFTTWTSNQ